MQKNFSWFFFISAEHFQTRKKKSSCEKTFFSYFDETFCTLMWHCFLFSHVCQTERRKWFFQENHVNIREGLELLQKGFFYKRSFFVSWEKKTFINQQRGKLLEKGLSFFYQEKIFFNVNVLSREGRNEKKKVSQKMFFSQQTYFLTREGSVTRSKYFYHKKKYFFHWRGRY